MTDRLRTWAAAAVVCLSSAALAGCATTEAERAAAAAGVYMNAYGRGDRDAVAAVTVPSKRDRPLEDGIQGLARGFTGVTEAEVDGNWAIAGARVRLVGPTTVVPILMRRTDEGWQVATIVPPGLTEVFSAFPEYPDQPPDRLEYMPTRRLTSHAWTEDDSTEDLLPGSPTEVVLEQRLSELGSRTLFPVRPPTGERERPTAIYFLKFSVAGHRRVRLAATALPGAGLRIEVLAPEGGRRGSGDEDSKKRGDHFYESDGTAGVEMNLFDATYLLAVLAEHGTRVRIAFDTAPREDPHR